MIRRNTIVMGFGRPGTGKSQLLHDLFSTHAPRVITLQAPPGETRERNPHVIEVVGIARLLDVIAHAEAHGYGRWHIDAALEPEDERELFALLAPRLGSGAESLSLALGGLAVECGELDTLAPIHGTSKEVLAAFRRGRHYALDLLMATQRPAAVAVDARSLAGIVFSFPLESEQDTAAAARELRVADPAEIANLPRFNCLYRTREDGRTVQLDAARNEVRELNARPLAE